MRKSNKELERKREFWNSLVQQYDLMMLNASRMELIYGKDSNAKELFGAAKITAEWMTELDREIEQ